jgi:hypothetical protein
MWVLRHSGRPSRQGYFAQLLRFFNAIEQSSMHIFATVITQHLCCDMLVLASQAYQHHRSIPPTYTVQDLTLTASPQPKGKESLFGAVHPCQ